MSTCDIESVGERIRYTVSEFIKMGALPNDPTAIYTEHESLAIRYLDAEHMDWPDGVLEHYLQVYLYCIQKELGIAETI